VIPSYDFAAASTHSNPYYHPHSLFNTSGAVFEARGDVGGGGVGVGAVGGGGYSSGKS